MLNVTMMMQQVPERDDPKKEHKDDHDHEGDEPHAVDEDSGNGAPPTPPPSKPLHLDDVERDNDDAESNPSDGEEPGEGSTDGDDGHGDAAAGDKSKPQDHQNPYHSHIEGDKDYLEHPEYHHDHDKKGDDEHDHPKKAHNKDHLPARRTEGKDEHLCQNLPCGADCDLMGHCQPDGSCAAPIPNCRGGPPPPPRLCPDGSCGAVCDNMDGMMTVIRHCQEDGSCAAPVPECLGFGFFGDDTAEVDEKLYNGDHDLSQGVDGENDGEGDTEQIENDAGEYSGIGDAVEVSSDE